MVYMDPFVITTGGETCPMEATEDEEGADSCSKRRKRQNVTVNELIRYSSSNRA